MIHPDPSDNQTAIFLLISSAALSKASMISSLFNIVKALLLK